MEKADMASRLPNPAAIFAAPGGGVISIQRAAT